MSLLFYQFYSLFKVSAKFIFNLDLLFDWIYWAGGGIDNFLGENIIGRLGQFPGHLG